MNIGSEQCLVGKRSPSIRKKIIVRVLRYHLVYISSRSVHSIRSYNNFKDASIFFKCRPVFCLKYHAIYLHVQIQHTSCTTNNGASIACFHSASENGRYVIVVDSRSRSRQLGMTRIHIFALSPLTPPFYSLIGILFRKNKSY